MVAGADEILDLMARGKKKVTLTMDTEPFEEADMLELTEICGTPTGGGFYNMLTYQGKPFNRKMWLCDVTLFVFGNMPERLYVRKEEDS